VSVVLLMIVFAGNVASRRPLWRTNTSPEQRATVRDHEVLAHAHAACACIGRKRTDPLIERLPTKCVAINDDRSGIARQSHDRIQPDIRRFRR
jgi:hypothetical protein